MPLYDYDCECGATSERFIAIHDRDNQVCSGCLGIMVRRVGAPLFRFAGRVTPGGGPDKFTADMLGIPLKELPIGLRSDRPAEGKS